MLAHGIRQGRATFNRGTNAGECFLKGRAVLIGCQDLQALYQWKPGINHDRELAEEDGNVLCFYGSRSKCGHHEFFALFADSGRVDLLAPQLRGQYLFVDGDTLSGNFFSGRILS